LLSAIVGLDGLPLGLIALAGLVLPAWALVDAIGRPTGAFQAAGSNKAMWISLIVVLWFFTFFLGVLAAVIYLGSIRPRVRAITGRRR
jgi:Na+-driven multidrug efflux pump